MRKVLISPLGLSPGVVTGAYYALEEDFGRMDRIVTISTDSRLTRLCEQVIERELELIEDDSGHFVEYGPACREHIPRPEVKTKEDVRLFTRKIRDLLYRYSEAGDKVYLNLTGGRKSMIAAAAMAAQFFPPELAFHLWVHEDIERDGPITRLLRKPEAKRRPYLRPDPDKIALVPVEIQLAIAPEEAEEKYRQLWGRLLEVEVGYYVEEKLGYPFVRTRYVPSWLSKGGDIDIYAERRHNNVRKVIVAESKLTQVRLKAVNQAIDNRSAAQAHFDAVGQVVEIKAWVVTTEEGQVDWDAQTKARQENVELYAAKLPGNWKDRADWSVSDIRPLVQE